MFAIIKWPFKLLGILIMFVFLVNYSSCTRQEHLIPVSAVVTMTEGINYIHRGFWHTSEWCNKQWGKMNFEQFLKSQNIPAAPPLDTTKQ